jgi:outer membrane receptor protein involved in Fe transport
VLTFYSLTDNWIQWLPTSQGYWTPQNIKTVERKGVELNVAKFFKINKSNLFMTKATYTFVSAINKENSSIAIDLIGKQLMYVPMHTIGGAASYSFKRMEVLYTQSIYSKTFIDAVNQYYLPYVAPADLQIGGTLVDNHVEVYFALKVQNIFNESYQIIANQPMPGRFFSVLFRLSLAQ